MTRQLATLRRLPFLAAAILIALDGNPFLQAERASAVTVAPGGSGAIGTQNEVNFFPAADDILQIEFDGVTTQGVDYDFLDVTNIANLAGKLEVRPINGFTPSLGNQFDFLDAGTQTSNEFDSVSWISPVPGLALSVRYPNLPADGIVGLQFVTPRPASNLTTSGSWHDPNLWNLDPGLIPGLPHDVTLDNGIGPPLATIFISADNAFANSVTLSATGGNTMNLQVNQAHNLSASHGVTINSGGGLSGFGTVVGDVDNAGGTVGPGSLSGPPVGTLTIDGDYHQGPGGTLRIDTRNGQADLLAASGDIHLEGTLEINVNDFFPNGPFPIARAQGDITLDLDNVNPIGLPPFSLTVQEVMTQNGTENQLDVEQVGLFNFDLDPLKMVTPADVDDFLLALINPLAWKAAHETATHLPPTAGSLAGNVSGYIDLDPGLLTTDDIAGFNAALNANGYPGSLWNYVGVPEPASGAMLVICILTSLSQRPSRRRAPTSRYRRCDRSLSNCVAECAFRGGAFPSAA